ncbi:MAG: hypothetical protein EOM20_02595 [Spartobacteria bacterium]|nr:hypothetical protein [Spartobacteria bacterium]
MSDGLDSSDAGVLNTEGYLDNIYRVNRPDADAERQQSGERFEDALQEKEEGENKDHANEKEEKNQHNPLPARPPQPIHDDVLLSEPAKRILEETACDKTLEELAAEDDAEDAGDPAARASGGHIDILA